MGKLAGFWKKVKHSLGNAFNWVGNSLQELSKTGIIKTLVGVIPQIGILAKPVNKIVEKVGTTTSKIGDAIDDKISGEEFWDYFNNEYKHASLLGPINEAKTMYDSVKNSDNIFTGIWDGIKNNATDMWNYSKQFFE